MKKILTLLTVIGLLLVTLIPLQVGARCCCDNDLQCVMEEQEVESRAEINWNAVNCCDLAGGCLSHCCAMQTRWYKVSYAKATTPYIFWGKQYWHREWTVEYVIAHDRDEAAEMFGLRAGYSCFVSYPLQYNIDHPVESYEPD